MTAEPYVKQDPNPAPLVFKMPERAIDSHMHVIGPFDRFPLSRGIHLEQALTRITTLLMFVWLLSLVIAAHAQEIVTLPTRASSSML